ncbi:LOW QUALITY PROTEIN: caveolin-1-like [Dreissena polymorpha]|uniref:LOW QUALITY PROTEIN: caveolin-1-like n=1 Tax=Dreissena polymorpha TaxID=45954 RepID=UPI0022650C5E|nr:LOW QUALITY PROTEIN: caveolin-1-like [Dreissena polymorpha]
MADQLDMVQRDPNDLNSHIKVRFEDVLGEPDGAHSIDCVWKLAFTCFECGKGLCYKLLTILCGICIALAWGCNFALVAFDHVWCYTPCIRDFSICVGCFQKVYGTIIMCAAGPVCEACGMMFSKIKVQKS